MELPEQCILALQALNEADRPWFIDGIDQSIWKEMDQLSGHPDEKFQDLEKLAELHAAFSEHEDPTIRKFGASTIGILAGKDLNRAEPYIECYLNDPDENVRAEFAEFSVGGVFESSHERAAEIFTQLFKDESDLVRAAAEEEIADIGAIAEFIPPSLGIGLVATYQTLKNDREQ